MEKKLPIFFTAKKDFFTFHEQILICVPFRIRISQTLISFIFSSFSVTTFPSGKVFSFLSEMEYCSSACQFLLISLQCFHNRDSGDNSSVGRVLISVSLSIWIAVPISEFFLNWYYRTFFLSGRERVIFLIRLRLKSCPLFCLTCTVLTENRASQKWCPVIENCEGYF